jgi:hypothetical protein
MSQEASQEAPEQEDSAIGASAAGLGAAITAMLQALLMLIMVLLTIAARALQALLILARVAMPAATTIVAGFGAVTLFQSVLARYGGDWQAAMLATAAVCVTPAAIMAEAKQYGVWPALAAAGALMILFRFGLDHAPPTIAAMLPVAGLATSAIAIMESKVPEVPEKEASNETAERQPCVPVAGDIEPDRLHSYQKL